MRHYSIKVLIRILLLAVLIFMTILAFMDDRIFINRFILLILLGIALSELFWFLHFTNRQLTLFIESLKNKDYTIHFKQKGTRGSINLLNRSFQEVIHQARKERTDQKGQDQFLELAFDHLNAGILSVSESGTITQMNKKAGELLGTGRLHSLDILERIHPGFKSLVSSVDSHNQILELKINNRPITLSLRATRLKIVEEEFKLIVFHDIRGTLEAKEIESWTRLIRILTHEIMNSVTPIASLSEAMHQQLLSKDEIKPRHEISQSQLQDLSLSLQTINRRSEGLLSFVEDYRKLTRIGKPSIQPVQTGKFVAQLLSLLKQEITARGITVKQTIDPESVIQIDPVLIEQALINILRNAMDALENIADPEITVEFKEDSGYHCLIIKDNGNGISPDELKEVFVPFFTTKKSGSGIGLSLARQILHAHGGTIQLDSNVTHGTVCSLFLPANT